MPAKRANSRLKRINRRLLAVNKHLLGNIGRLESLTDQLKRYKKSLIHKYQHKIRELSKIKEELQDIFKVNHTLNSAVDLKKLFSLIIRLTCELMRTDTCSLLIFEEGKKNLAADNPIYEKALRSKKPVVVCNVDNEVRNKYPQLKRRGIKSFVCMPVLSKDKALGVISTFSKKEGHFSVEQIEVLAVFASQVAIAIQECRHYEDIRRNYFSTVHALVLAEEARDPYMRGHTERVTRLAVEVAKKMNLSDSEIEVLRYGCEVHDIGKISIPDFILNKPGRLTPAERAIIELHPVKGEEMLSPLEFLSTALPIVRGHHERYDGTGYPDGLAEDKIPLLSKIVACADAFDAMTSDRPYRRRKLTTEEALSEIKNNSGSQFDPQIASLFIKIMRSRPRSKALM